MHWLSHVLEIWPRGNLVIRVPYKGFWFMSLVHTWPAHFNFDMLTSGWLLTFHRASLNWYDKWGWPHILQCGMEDHQYSISFVNGFQTYVLLGGIEEAIGDWMTWRTLCINWDIDWDVICYRNFISVADVLVLSWGPSGVSEIYVECDLIPEDFRLYSMLWRPVLMHCMPFVGSYRRLPQSSGTGLVGGFVILKHAYSLTCSFNN